MHDFLQNVLYGLGPGALEGILAAGIVLIYRTTGVVNFALGTTGTVAAYVVYSVSQGKPMWAAVLASILVAGVLGALTYGSITGIRTRHYALTAAIATLAVSILLQEVVRTIWGISSGFPSVFSTNPITLGSLSITPLYLAGIITGLALVSALGAYLRWSRSGTMIRAIADDPDAARLAGANVSLLMAGVWALAGGLAAVSAFFLAQISFDPFFIDPFFLAALVAAVLGGLRSLSGAFLGAVVLEVVRTLFETYGGSLAVYAQTFLLLLLILVLVLAPRRWLARGAGRVV